MPDKAIFLDRDDTLVEDPGYINHPDQIRLLDGVAESLAELKQMDYKLILISKHAHFNPETREVQADEFDAFTPEEFYNRLETAKVMPSTSQPSVADFEVVFRRLHQQGYDILAVLISEDLSGTVSSAMVSRRRSSPLSLGKALGSNCKSSHTPLTITRVPLPRRAPWGLDLTNASRSSWSTTSPSKHGPKNVW